MTSPRVYVFAVVVLLVLSVLVLNRIVPSKTAPTGDISVLNKTSAFQVLHAQHINNRLTLSLKNNSAQTVTAFVITVGHDFRITEDFITSEVPDKVGIKSQKTFEKTYPISATLRTAPVTLQAVVFEDKTGDGDPIIFENVRDTHLGQAVQLKRFLQVFNKHVNGSSPPNTDNLRHELETVLDGPETETVNIMRELHPTASINRNGNGSVSGFVKQGLEAAKIDILRRTSEFQPTDDTTVKLQKLNAYYEELLRRL